jgi:surface protein
MNKYIKHIIEGFDFNIVNNNNKNKSIIDAGITAGWKYYIDNIKNNIKPDIDLTKYIAIYAPNDLNELKEIITHFLKLFDHKQSLNWLDVKNIKDMSYLFNNIRFNGDISKWDVSNVEYMNNMFEGSSFTGDISKWDVSNVEDMSSMFA